jgi:hypothetical protein
VSRLRTHFVAAAITLGLVVLFVVFIGFKDDAALLAALSAAGTVAAGAFAAVAAVGSMRAAAESGAAARRSHEAMARTVRPRVRPSAQRQDGTVLGTVRCEPSRLAVDVHVVWMPADRDPIPSQLDRLAPGEAITIDLELPDTAPLADAITMVWIGYRDEDGVGHWQDTWEVATESPVTFHQIDSQLVD